MALSIKKNNSIFVSKLVQHTLESSLCWRGKLSKSGGQRYHIDSLVIEREQKSNFCLRKCEHRGGKLKKKKVEIEQANRCLLCSVLGSEKEVNLTVIKSGECKWCCFCLNSCLCLYSLPFLYDTKLPTSTSKALV